MAGAVERQGEVFDLTIQTGTLEKFHIPNDLKTYQGLTSPRSFSDTSFKSNEKVFNKDCFSNRAELVRRWREVQLTTAFNRENPR